jgi:hypothetical protein
MLLGAASARAWKRFSASSNFAGSMFPLLNELK